MGTVLNISVVPFESVLRPLFVPYTHNLLILFGNRRKRTSHVEDM